MSRYIVIKASSQICTCGTAKTCKICTVDPKNDSLIERVLPNIRLILLEPFVLNGPFTTEHYEALAVDIRRRGEIVKKLAQKHGCHFIALQDKIAALASQSAENTVLMDGIHPTCIGHELISRELYDVYRTIL